VKEYDIFVPLYFNDGRPVEAQVFQSLQETLLGQFGGLTFFPQPNKGFWRMEEVTYRDEIDNLSCDRAGCGRSAAILVTTQTAVEGRPSAGRDSDCRARD
jgi:hypothetical protein